MLTHATTWTATSQLRSSDCRTHVSSRYQQAFSFSLRFVPCVIDTCELTDEICGHPLKLMVDLMVDKASCVQCVELDFQYASEGIHRRWDAGFRITACAATPDQAAFVLSVPRRRPMDETQETLRTSAFPSTHVKARAEPGNTMTVFTVSCFSGRLPSSPSTYYLRCIICELGYDACVHHDGSGQRLMFHLCVQDKWAKNLYIAGVAYGRTVS